MLVCANRMFAKLQNTMVVGKTYAMDIACELFLTEQRAETSSLDYGVQVNDGMSF